MTSMGRRRTKGLDLPPRMHWSDGSYYHTSRGKTRRWTNIGPDLAEARRRWAELEDEPLPADLATFAAIAARFRTDYIPKRAAKTQTEYSRGLDKLISVFGGMALDAIIPAHVQTYIERRGAPVAANREKALLSAFWNWARSKGYTNLPNPCAGIKGHREDGRKTYIDDALYLRVYEAADAPLQNAMTLAYLTGQRVRDVLRMKRSDIKNGAIEVRQAKTGAILRISIVGALAELIACLTVSRPGVTSMFLLTDERGRPLTYASLTSRFAAAREATGVEPAAFQFRDLRPKAATDLEDLALAQKLLGHSHRDMTEHYVKKRVGEVVQPIGKAPAKRKL